MCFIYNAYVLLCKKRCHIRIFLVPFFVMLETGNISFACFYQETFPFRLWLGLVSGQVLKMFYLENFSFSSSIGKQHNCEIVPLKDMARKSFQKLYLKTVPQNCTLKLYLKTVPQNRTSKLYLKTVPQNEVLCLPSFRRNERGWLYQQEYLNNKYTQELLTYSEVIFHICYKAGTENYPFNLCFNNNDGQIFVFQSENQN